MRSCDHHVAAKSHRVARGLLSVERYGGGPIVIRDYDPAWPRMFADERARIEQALGLIATTIEHVGSTAVPGLAAKPIIDILVGVVDLEAARSDCITNLTRLGYTHMAAYEAWLPGEILFRKVVEGRWTHHVHVTERTGDRWLEFILVRDYLRGHPKAARAYGDVKKAIALQFGDDVEGYREAKRATMAELIDRARDMPRALGTQAGVPRRGSGSRGR
jgi:GrpB-like predicted nucleotidyltransferase (UPF0157 family)